jgi:hypothetical protein
MDKVLLSWKIIPWASCSYIKSKQGLIFSSGYNASILKPGLYPFPRRALEKENAVNWCNAQGMYPNKPVPTQSIGTSKRRQLVTMLRVVTTIRLYPT